MRLFKTLTISVATALTVAACGSTGTTDTVVSAAEALLAAISKSRTDALAQTSVYRIGYPVQVAITGESLGTGAFAANTFAQKHYSMGRIAWELAYVMPDNKTIYGGDDGSKRGMFRFVADKAEDLTAGTLYAAKLTQTSTVTAANGGSFDITWINLGRATDSEIDASITKGVKFSDLFDQTPVVANACPSDYKPSDTEYGAECLKIKTSNALKMSALEIQTAASRLEAVRYAAIMGATTEFNKFEGVTYDPGRNKLYIAISDITGAFSAASTLTGLSNDIMVSANRCGGVYQLSVDPTTYVTTNMSPLVMGAAKSYAGDANFSSNTCDLDKIANPDNVVMGPTKDILFIGEDTGAHQNDVLWAYNLTNGSLTRIFSTPYGSETTSPFVYQTSNPTPRTINATNDYLTMVVQHPYDESDTDKVPSKDDPLRRAYVGVIALPKINYATDTVSFTGIPVATTDAEKREVKAAPSITVNGVTTALTFNTLLRSGDKPNAANSAIWGQHIDVNGKPLINYSAKDMANGISTSPDHTTLLKKGASLFSITQFEEGAGMMYITKLSDTAGVLAAVDTKPVNLSATYGGYTFCAGMPTPWGTHLGGEEYPTDANAFEKAKGIMAYFDPYLEFFGFKPTGQ